MAHEISSIDRVGLKGQQAWHGLGVVIDDNLSATAAAERFGLCWPVARYALQAIAPDGTIIPIDSHVANIRTADCDGNSIKHLLGVVGADYQVCQNRELAEFTDALAQTGKVVIESAGCIRGGKRVWFLARGEQFEIGGTKDKIWPYVLVSNGHDGGQSIRVTPTTVRVVCSNTLHLVIPATDDAARFDEAAISIRHCGKIADKLEQAKLALRYYGETLARNREMFEAMQAKQVDAATRMKLFADTYAANWEVATADELASFDKEIAKTAKHRAERMRRAADDFLHRYTIEKHALGTGDSLWAAFNAVTGFVQHSKVARGSSDVDRVERRVDSNLFGLNAQRTRQVLGLALSV
jgi:phage/plasmid-like protein (TIGR03299 family)